MQNGEEAIEKEIESANEPARNVDNCDEHQQQQQQNGNVCRKLYCI